MRSPELELVNTFVTSAALAFMRGDPFLFFEKPPFFEIPCLPSTYSSDLFRSSSFSCVEKHLNEQGFLFLGFTWGLVQFLLYSRGIKRGKQKLSLNGRVALCWYRVKHPRPHFLVSDSQGQPWQSPGHPWQSNIWTKTLTKTLASGHGEQEIFSQVTFNKLFTEGSSADFPHNKQNLNPRSPQECSE